MERITKPADKQKPKKKKNRFKNLKKFYRAITKDKIIIMSLRDSLFCNFVFGIAKKSN